MKGRKTVAGQPGASSSGGVVEEKPRKKWITLSDPNKEIPKCHVCGKVFLSWYALYGHMNAHSSVKRGRRILPAPLSTTPGGVSLERNGGNNGDHAGEFVLNVDQEMQILGAALPRSDGLIIDLNEPPAQEEEEEEDGGDGHDENEEGDNSAAK